MPTVEEIAFQGNTPNTLIQPTAAGYVVHAYQAGIVTFRKDYAQGAPDFITQINLGAARVISVTGGIANPHSGAGPFGGDNPEVATDLVVNFWPQAVQYLGARAYAIVNAGFFATGFNPTSLAFPLKHRNLAISDGYASTTEFQNPMRIKLLKFQDNRAVIQSFPDSAQMGADLHSSPVKNIIGGLDEEADKGILNWVGRTFIGLAREDNGYYHTLMIYSSAFATQPWATGILVNDFTCNPDQILMLDGGGSAQLTLLGQQEISSVRAVPHVLVVSSN
jgi:hypothetical protein